MANDVKAGEAYVEVTARDQAAQKAIARFASRLGSIGSALEGVGNKALTMGGALALPLLGAAKAYADAGSALVDMSDRTGVAIEQLSTLKFAAEQSGASLESLESGLKFMQKNLAAAFSGDAGAVEKLERLGVSLDDLRGKAPDEQFRILADAIAGISDPAARTAAAMELFGRGGAQLLPLLKEGAAGIAELQAKAESLGLKMTAETAKAAEEFGDRLDALKMQAGALANVIGAALLPELSSMLDSLQPLAAETAAWISQHEGLVRTLAEVAAATLAVGVAAKGLGVAFGVAAGAVKAYQTAVVAARIATQTFNAVVARSPVGLLAVGLGAAAAALYAYSAAADEAAETMPQADVAPAAAKPKAAPKPKPPTWDDEPPPRPRTKEEQRNYDARLWDAREKLAQSERRPIPDIRGAKDAAESTRLVTASQTGTFNAAAAFSLGAASPVDRLVDEAERQRRELEELNRKADRAKLVFGA